MTSSLTSIELFCGAGGLAIGVHQAGFEIQAAYEFNDKAAQTLRTNRPGWPVFTSDVRHVDFRRHLGVNLVSGGPPCQPFSMAGKGAAHEDPRDMFPHAIRAVREARPEAFVFENVRGLMREEFALYLEYVTLQLSAPQQVRQADETWNQHLARLRSTSSQAAPMDRYRVVARLLDAADYGVPQSRERLFLVGFRGDLGLTWVPPAATHSAGALHHAQRTGAYQQRHGLPAGPPPAMLFDLPPTLEPHVTVRDTLARLALTPDLFPYPPLLNVRAYPGHTGSLLDQPSKTIKAGPSGVPGGENMYVDDAGACHSYTPREAAALQTFPEGYRFQGSRSDALRQIGNAVPVRLAYGVARSVAERLMAQRVAEAAD